jgi:hypothetical protein
LNEKSLGAHDKSLSNGVSTKPGKNEEALLQQIDEITSKYETELSSIKS